MREVPPPDRMFAHTLVQCVAEATNVHGPRSSKRTDRIHHCIRQYIESRNPRVECKVEYKLSTEMDVFKVDVAIFARNTNALVACLLFKGLTSSISKNDKNYEHNKIGEAVKAKSGMGSAKLVYLDVVPVRCPTYRADKSVLRWETHAPADVRARSLTVAKVANKLAIAPIIDDIYTVSVDYEYHPDQSIAVKEMVDATDLDRFEALIEGLAAEPSL